MESKGYISVQKNFKERWDKGFHTTQKSLTDRKQEDKTDKINKPLEMWLVHNKPNGQ